MTHSLLSDDDTLVLDLSQVESPSGEDSIVSPAFTKSSSSSVVTMSEASRHDPHTAYTTSSSSMS
jgi:hypothetical protein